MLKKLIVYFMFMIVLFSSFSPLVRAYDSLNAEKNSLVMLDTKYVDCGKIKKVPVKFIDISNKVINLLQIAVPIILIFMKGIDLLKAIASQKEDEIKKAQGLFVKRLIFAVLLYFVFVIVKVIVSVIGNDDGILDCTECMINGVSNCK